MKKKKKKAQCFAKKVKVKEKELFELREKMKSIEERHKLSLHNFI